MGLYVYNVRKSKSVKASFEGREIAVFRCAYTCKHGQLATPWSSNRKYTFPYDALMGRLQASWGDEKPEFVAVVEGKGFEDGLRIYRWAGGLEWVDCDKIPGECVGLLRKQGRRWIVEALGEVATKVAQDRFARVLA